MALSVINLAPLEANNDFTDYQSELKIFEAAAMGVPTIASPTTPFRRSSPAGITVIWLRATMSGMQRSRDWCATRRCAPEWAMLRSAKSAARFDVRATVNEAIAITMRCRKVRRENPLRCLMIPRASRPMSRSSRCCIERRRKSAIFLKLCTQDFVGRYEIVLIDDVSPDDLIRGGS